MTTSDEPPVILYIEDNPDNQRLVVRALRNRGYHVALADDGMSGISAARDSQPALILVDINIPGLDGYEVTTRLRSMPHLQHTPIVALTADVSPGARERVLAVGCNGYLSKPINPRQLPEQIASYLNGKHEQLAAAIETDLLRQHHSRTVERLEHRVRELQAANADLQELDEMKNQFLASLSHELRTPLAVVQGYLDMLNTGTLGDLSEPQREAIQVARRNLNTLGSQVNNLLYLQELRSSELTYETADLCDLIAGAAADLRAAADRADITVTLDTPRIAPLNLDGGAMSLALYNLLDNAIKFTPRGGSVTVALAQHAEHVSISVSDTGVGIPREALNRIFQPFYRLATPYTTDTPGNGIGLALVQHIVEAHHGHITVQSIPAQGSTFTITLPRP